MKIQGQQFYLWRAVDQEGDVLDILVTKRRKIEELWLTETTESWRLESRRLAIRVREKNKREAPGLVCYSGS